MKVCFLKILRTVLGSFLLAANLYGELPLGATWKRVDDRAGSAANDFFPAGSDILAVGNDGAIWRTPDRKNWTAEPCGILANWHSVYVENGVAVVVGEGGMTARSEVAGEWLVEYVGEEVSLNSVIFAGDRFVAVAEEGRVFWSADGRGWQSWPTNTVEDLNDVAWKDGVFYAVGANHTVITAELDGEWTHLFTPTNNIPYGDVVVGESGYLATFERTHNDLLVDGTFYVAVSDSGEGQYLENGNWESFETAIYDNLIAVKKIGAEYLAMTPSRSFATSSDGKSWSTQNLNRYYECGCWFVDRYLIAGRQGGVAISVSGENWQTVKTGIAEDLVEVETNGTVVVSVGSEGGIYRSSDGVIWARTFSDYGGYLADVHWTGSEFWVVGEKGLMLSSSDGMTWVVRSPGRLDDVIWDGARFLAFSGKNVMASQDGELWVIISTVSKPPSGNDYSDYQIADLLWTGTEYIAVGEKRWLLRSSDGVNWTQGSITVTPGSYFYDSSSVACSDSVCVVMSSGSGGHLVSPDSMNWLLYDDDDFFGAHSQSVTWDGDCFVATSGHRVLGSEDGITWDVLSEVRYPDNVATWDRKPFQFAQIIWDGNRYVGCGYLGSINEGVVGTSVDGVNWDNIEVVSGGNFLRLASEAGVTVAVRDDGLVMRLVGNDWTQELSGIIGKPASIVASNGSFVVFSETGMVSKSAVAGTWVAGAVRLSFDEILQSVSSSGNTIIVGGGGWHGGEADIYLSQDGANWESQNFPGYTGPFSEVIWNGIEFIVLGGNTVLRSPDGQNWQSMPIAASSGDAKCLVWWNGKVVVGGNRNIWQQEGNSLEPVHELSGSAVTSLVSNGERLLAHGTGEPLYSEDGEKWIPSNISSHIGETLSDVIYTGAEFIACGVAGQLKFSQDGELWETREIQGLPRLTSLIKNNTEYVGVGNGFTHSVDGVNWTSSYSQVEYQDVAFGNGIYVAVSGASVATSEDGIEWVLANTGLGSVMRATSILWTGDEFVLSSEEGGLAVSQNGIDWDVSIIPGGVVSIASSGSEIVACDSDDAVYRSNDGVLWSPIPDRRGRRLSFQGGRYFLFGSNFYTSVDGESWGRPSRTYADVVWTGSEFVGVGNYGQIGISTVGASWSGITSGVSKDLMKVAWSGSELVAVGEDGIVLTSSDGNTWTTVPSGTTETLVDVEWIGSQYVMLTQEGELIYSDQGPVTPIDFKVNDLWSDGNEVTIVGDAGRLATLEGSVWVEKESATENGLCALSISNLGAYACGNNGTILSRDSAGVWAKVAGWPIYSTSFAESHQQTSRNYEVYAAHSHIEGVNYAIGSDGSVATSEDGRVWTKIEKTERYDLTGFAESDSGIHVVSERGHISSFYETGMFLFHYDYGTDFQEVAFGGGRLVAVGDQGIIFLSKPGDIDDKGYLSWADLQGLPLASNPEEDSNSDGVSNLSSYFFGINPIGTSTEDSRGRVPVISNELEFTFTYQGDRPDLEVRIEKSQDLIQWSEVTRKIGLGGWSHADGITVEEVDGATRRISIANDQSENELMFYRLQFFLNSIEF